MMCLAFVLYVSAVSAQYVPEPYGWACFRMAAKRDWPSCSSAPRSKQRDCLCQIPEFMVLTESCLQDAVANITSNVEVVKATARRESLCRLPESYNQVTPGTLQSRLKSSLGYEDALELEYVEPIHPEEIHIAIRTAEWRMTNDRRATRAGAILIAFWMVVLLLRYLASLIKRLTPDPALHFIMTRSLIKKAQANLLNPPLGRKNHCQPSLGPFGTRIPTRMFSLLIILFAALNYALIFTAYPYEPMNFIYTSRRQQYNKSMAIRAAFMIMWKLPLLVCFSGRNNIFLLLKHPWPLDTFNVLHKWIARITIVDVIIHSVAISLVKAEQGLYGYVWKVGYWRWGIAGTTIAALIAFQSMHWISKRYYDGFIAAHIILGVLFLVLAWYHVRTLPYGKCHVVATSAIWGFDRVMRCIRIILSGRVTAEVKHYNGNVTILTLKAPSLYYRQKCYSSNSYVYLHVPCWYLFWQSHPFTIVKKGFKDSDFVKYESSGVDSARPSLEAASRERKKLTLGTETRGIIMSNTELMLCIKHRQGITRFISSLPEGPLNVVLDGPYGYSHPLHRFSKIVLFAGGIGITPVFGYAKRIVELCPNGSDIQIHWAVSDLASMCWALEELTTASKDSITITVYLCGLERGLDVVTDYSRQVTFVYQRMNCMEVLSSEVIASNAAECDLQHAGLAGASSRMSFDCTEVSKGQSRSHHSLAIFSCGPDSLNDDARVSACWAIENARVYVDYYEESFSW